VRAIQSAASASSLIILAGIASASGVLAQESDRFYSGNTINLIIGFNPGGGYDTYGRMLARHLPRHIEGQPSIVIRNMPGGGSIIAANHLYNVAPKDGATLGLFGGSIATDPAIGGVPAKYDARRFTWIGSAYSDVDVCVSRADGPFKSADDLFRESMVTGSVGNAATYIFPVTMNSVLGAKLNIVSGYRGLAGLRLALDRGEVQGICGMAYGSIKSSAPAWLAEKQINILTQMTFTESQRIPGVPMLTDLAKSADDKRIIEVIFSFMKMGRPLAAPPDIPAARAAILRAAFDATMKDREFIAEAEKSGLEIDPTSGAEMESFLKDLYQTPRALMDRAAAVLGRDRK